MAAAPLPTTRWGYASLFYDGPVRNVDARHRVLCRGPLRRQYWDNAAFTFADLRPRPGFPTVSEYGRLAASLISLYWGGAGGSPRRPDTASPWAHFEGSGQSFLPLPRNVRPQGAGMGDLGFDLQLHLQPATARGPNRSGGICQGWRQEREDEGWQREECDAGLHRRYNPCGWRSFLNNVTLTVGVDNVTDEQPPFVAAAFENGYDQQTANNKGRLWYVGVKKRF